MKMLVVVEPSGAELTSKLPSGELELEALQKAVGGYIESVRVRYKGRLRQGYMNEDGRFQGLPYNPHASAMADEFGYGPLVGNLAIVLPVKTT